MEKTVKTKKAHAPSGALSDFALRVLSLAIAVIIWFALSITKFPTFTKTVLSVPVVFSMTGSTAESKGLSALNYQDVAVDVKIEGMNYEIGTYTANDLVATVNLDDVIKEGTYKLAIEVRSSHTNDQCKILSVTPSTVEVKFEMIDTVSFPIMVSSPNVSAAEGYTLLETKVQPGSVEISGSEKELERIARVEAVYSDSLSLTEDRTVTSSTLLLYDENNNLLSGDNYTITDKNVNIEYVVYKQVTALLTPQFTDAPPGFDLGSLPLVLSQDTIQIITPQLDAESKEEMKLNPVSLYDIARGKTFTTQISDLLSIGEVNQSGVEQVELSFGLDDYTTKSFTIPAESVTFINVPADKTVTLDSERITGIKIIGPKETIEKLKRKDLKAVIDLSDLSANGSISHEVVIYSESYSNIWNIGTHEAVITMSDKSAADASSLRAADSSSAKNGGSKQQYSSFVQ